MCFQIPWGIILHSLCQVIKNWQCVGVSIDGTSMLDDVIQLFILSCLVSNVCFNSIVQGSLYQTMDIDTMWHCALVSRTPSQSVGLVLRWALFSCWVSFCVPFTNSLMKFYYILIVLTIIGILMAILFYFYYMFRHSVLHSSANVHLNGCFWPWTFPSNIGLNMSPSDSFGSCLHFLIGCSTGSSRLCNWFSLQCSAPWINHLPPVCWSLFGCQVWNDSGFFKSDTLKNNVFIVFITFCIYILVPHVSLIFMSQIFLYNYIVL